MHPKHIRHKPPTLLNQDRELILACPQFRSGVNLSRIVRLAGCAGINKMIVCGKTKVDSKIARNAIDFVHIERHRTMTNWLKKTRSETYQMVALEQSDRSVDLFDFRFERKCVLVIGHERNGVPETDMSIVDAVVEIPVYGHPASYNVVTATTMAVYEYCRQFPTG